jgi:membrane protease YdiL (CAAX protease family)
VGPTRFNRLDGMERRLPGGVYPACMSDPAPSAERPFLPTFGQSLGLLALGFLVFGLPAGFVALLANVAGIEAGLYAFQALVLLGTIWLGHRWSERSWAENLPVHPVPVRLLPGFVVALAGVIVLGQAAGTVAASFLPPIPASVGSRFGRIGPFSAVVVAPLLEEALFRGVVLGGYRRAYRPAKAVLLCATVFAAWHLLPWQFPIALVAGTFFSWLALETGSLVLPVVAHAAVNAAGWVAHRRPDLFPRLDPEAATTWILGVILTAAGVWLLRRARPRPAAPAGPGSLTPTPP